MTVILASIVGTFAAIASLLFFSVGFGTAALTYFAAAGLFMAWAFSRPRYVRRELSADEQLEEWKRELGFREGEEEASTPHTPKKKTNAA